MTTEKELIFLIQFGPPPYLGASVPLAYSPYLTSGLVSPLLGSEQQLQHHQQPQQQPQPHIQQNIQNKQRPERIEVSGDWSRSHSEISHTDRAKPSQTNLEEKLGV